MRWSEIVANLIALARPGWIRVNAAILSARYVLGMAILIQVMRAGHWLVVSSPAIAPHALAILQTNVDLGMRIGIGFATAGMGLRIALEWWRVTRSQTRAPWAASA